MSSTVSNYGGEAPIGRYPLVDDDDLLLFYPFVEPVYIDNDFNYGDFRNGTASNEYACYDHALHSQSFEDNNRFCFNASDHGGGGNGNRTRPIQGINGPAFLFDGVDDYLRFGDHTKIPTITSPTDFTFILWVKHLSIPSSDGNFQPHTVVSGGNNEIRIRLQGDDLEVLTYDGSYNFLSLDNVGSQLLETWTMITWRHFDDNGQDSDEIWLNNSIEKTGNLPNPTQSGQGSFISIGANGTDPNFHGYMDWYMLFLRSLTDGEIKSMYEATKPGSKP